MSGPFARRGAGPRGLLLALAAATAPCAGLTAQVVPSLLVQGPDGSVFRMSVSGSRGYAAVSSADLERIGWTFFQDRDVARARSSAERDLLFRMGSPWVRWGERTYQLTDSPYLADGDLFLPLQVAVELLPQILPKVYEYRPDGSRLQVLDREFWRPERAASLAAVAPGAGDSAAGRPVAGIPPPGGKIAPDPGRPNGSSGPEPPPVPVVVIDPGHGGRDPGAVGRRGVEEKDIALALGLALARELRRDDTFEVRMTRDDDTFVPLWKRGEMATEWKGDRPGVFISLHANALPRSRSIRGYETYFLSEARTDHERRVAAMENAPLEMEDRAQQARASSDLSFILKDLRNRDYQHWSDLLAELVQSGLGTVHPGPNRGVKQAPFAVITNALMPSILVEVGFVTNPQEELLMGQGGFQSDAARALADAVREFFRRYPPGQTASQGAGR